MQIRRVVLPVFCLIAGLTLGATLTVRSQGHTPSLAELLLQTHNVSKMDWVLLNARVTAIGTSPMQKSSHLVTAMDFAYDNASKKIVARAFVNPEWLSQADVQQVKKIFTMRAIDFCGVAVAGELMKEGSPLGLSWRNNCSVRFVTWGTSKSGDLSSNDVAFFDNGQLVLN